MIRILDVVGELTGRLVVSDIAHLTVSGGVCPRGQGGVPDDGLGIRMAMVGIGEHDTLLQEIAEAPTTEMRRVTLQEITAQPINRDLQDESRAIRGLGARRSSQRP